MMIELPKLMLSLLEVMADGKQQQVQELIELLALKFNITNEQKQERMPNGQMVFNNQVRHALTGFKHSGFCEKSPKNGSWRITQLGLDVLKSNRTSVFQRLD